MLSTLLRVVQRVRVVRRKHGGCSLARGREAHHLPEEVGYCGPGRKFAPAAKTILDVITTTTTTTTMVYLVMVVVVAVVVVLEVVVVTVGGSGGGRRRRRVVGMEMVAAAANTVDHSEGARR